MTAVAILLVLLTFAIVGAELCRRIVDKRLLDQLAVDVAQSADALYFVTWDELRDRYAELGRRMTGLEGLHLLPLEGYATLQRVEKRLAPPDLDRKRAVLDNALETFPTTFDVYRYSGAMRALAAAITGGVAMAGQVRMVFVIIILSVILLTALPEAAMATHVLLRMRRRPLAATA